jgi:hypothetical protein
VAEQLSHAREASNREPETDKWALAFFYISRFSNTQTLKFKMVTFMMSKFPQILQVDCLKHKEQLYRLDHLQNPKGLHVTNFGINSNLNLL